MDLGEEDVKVEVASPVIATRPKTWFPGALALFKGDDLALKVKFGFCSLLSPVPVDLIGL